MYINEKAISVAYDLFFSLTKRQRSGYRKYLKLNGKPKSKRFNRKDWLFLSKD